MRDCCLFSMAVGFIIGALIVADSEKAQEMVEKGKKIVKDKIKKIK